MLVIRDGRGTPGASVDVEHPDLGAQFVLQFVSETETLTLPRFDVHLVDWTVKAAFVDVIPRRQATPQLWRNVQVGGIDGTEATWRAIPKWVPVLRHDEDDSRARALLQPRTPTAAPTHERQATRLRSARAGLSPPSRG